MLHQLAPRLRFKRFNRTKWETSHLVWRFLKCLLWYCDDHLWFFLPILVIVLYDLLMIHRKELLASLIIADVWWLLLVLQFPIIQSEPPTVTLKLSVQSLKVEQNIFCELELTALQLSSTFPSLAASTRPSTVPFLLSLGQPSLPSS